MEKWSQSKFETKSSPETVADKLASEIKRFKLKEYKPFQFNGIEYQIIWTDRRDETPGEVYESAWFVTSTEINGIDIYLQRTLSMKNKIRKLFHEILEADLSHRNISNPHDIALSEEERIFGHREG